VRNSRLRTLGFPGLLTLTFLAPNLVVAATTGPVPQGGVSPIPWNGPPPKKMHACLESEVKETPQHPGFMTNRSWAFVMDTRSCVPPATAVSPGMLGAKVEGWMDGAQCGVTTWVHSDVTAVYMLVQAPLCGNPAGLQEFWSGAYGRFWNAPTGNYQEYGPLGSPSQNMIVEEVEWSQAVGSPNAMGRVPRAAFTANGIDPSLMPDFVSVLTREGEVAGYARKADLISVDGRPPASHSGPIPVLDAQGRLLVGHMYPGLGFVPLGTSPTTVKPFEVLIEVH
jgi:hypothetical protein